TGLPSKKGSEQSVPQLMPGGVDPTVPAPVPFFTTLTSVRSRKLARTLVLLFGTRKVHELLVEFTTPLQLTPTAVQFVKTKPSKGCAWSVTSWPKFWVVSQSVSPSGPPPQSTTSGARLVLTTLPFWLLNTLVTN